MRRTTAPRTAAHSHLIQTVRQRTIPARPIRSRTVAAWIAPFELSSTPYLPPRAVVVAGSLGGLRALEMILRQIPREFPAPLLVAHHLSDEVPSYLAELLASNTSMPVTWATHMAPLEAGHVYVGPPGRHVTVTASGHCRLDSRPRHNFVRPAGGLLFRSAADCMGARTIAVVLSGRLDDGALGAAAVRAAGGVVIAQELVTCAAEGMPRSAIRTGAVNFILPPGVIGAALVSLAMVPGAREMFGAGVTRRPRAA